MDKFISSSNSWTDPSMLILVFLVVGLVLMMIWSNRRRRTAQEQVDKMLDSLRPGQRVRTGSGIIGRIKEIREEVPAHTNEKGITVPAVKSVLLQTGTDKYPAYMLIDIYAIYNVMSEEGHTIEGLPVMNLPAPEKQELPEATETLPNPKPKRQTKK